jgi:choline kinase
MEHAKRYQKENILYECCFTRGLGSWCYLTLNSDHVFRNHDHEVGRERNKGIVVLVRRETFVRSLEQGVGNFQEKI